MKEVRLEWQGGEELKFNINEVLLYNPVIHTLLRTLEEKLNLGISTSEPVYTSQVTQATLESAFQMFLYLANCPSLLLTRHVKEELIKFFVEASPRTIIEIILKINKLENKKAEKEMLLPDSPIGRMVAVLDSSLKLDVGKISSSVLSRSELLTLSSYPEFGSIRNFLHECLTLDNCSQVSNYLELLGTQSPTIE